MELSERRCYQIMVSRDPRFDGKFFAAVVTTGIYCRPICPARKPKPDNVRFFACAAAAEAAGFRPCRRCRPDAAPGTPAWNGTSATVARALRLIAAGVLDEGGVGDLAARLGMGARQLRRLFAERLGASPRAVAKTRRVHFARKLIDETRMPMAAIAHGAGFQSVRQFNDAIRKTFGKSPSEIRRQQGLPLIGGLTLRLPYRPPLDWNALIGFLAPRAIPGVEAVDGESYSRTVRVGGESGVIRVTPVAGESHLELELRAPATPRLVEVVERARHLFDLDADPLAITTGLQCDPALAPVVADRPGIRVPGAWDGFELAVRAILGQQITVRGATTLAGRLVQRFGEPLARAGATTAEQGARLSHLFPTPDRLADADLQTIGLTLARAAAIRSLARAVGDGAHLFESREGLEATIERLTGLPGIGDWSAHYIAMRALREPDAFPAGDLGLRRAFGALSGGPLPATEGALARSAEAWRPWRAYAAMLLWTGSSTPA